MTQRSHPILTLALMALAAVGTWAWMERKQEAQVAAVVSTAETRFHRAGVAAVAQGHVTDAREARRIVKRNLGPELARETTSAGGTVVGTLDATAEVPAAVSSPEPAQTSTAGAATNARLVQDRGGNPPLASVAVRVEGGQVIAQWTANRERFHLSTATWRGAADGLHAGLRLSREVFSPDGVQLGGREEIPVTGADAWFPAAEVQRLAPMPTWSLAAGTATDSRTGRAHPIVIYGRQWSRHWGTDFGHVNGNTFATVRYTGGFK